MTFGQISYGKYRQRARTLRNLKIDEVSSVDRGAGHGVQVRLLKRDATPSATEVRKWDGVGTPPGADRGYRYVTGEPNMPTLQDRIAKSHAAAVQGEISFTQAALDQQNRAMEMFPLAKSVGQALDQYGQTAIGKRDIQNLKDLQFLKSQWDNRIGDGARAVLKHGGAGPQIHFDNDKSGAVNDDGKEHATSDPDGVEESWDKRVENLMSQYGMSKDAAISYLHRAEKIAKGF
jgi:hypothetical protein